MASKTQNCGKNRANWKKRLFILVSVTPKLIESVEISYAPKSLSKLPHLTHIWPPILIWLSDLGCDVGRWGYSVKCFRKALTPEELNCSVHENKIFKIVKKQTAIYFQEFLKFLNRTPEGVGGVLSWRFQDGNSIRNIQVVSSNRAHSTHLWWGQ